MSVAKGISQFWQLISAVLYVWPVYLGVRGQVGGLPVGKLGVYGVLPVLLFQTVRTRLLKTKMQTRESGTKKFGGNAINQQILQIFSLFSMVQLFAWICLYIHIAYLLHFKRQFWFPWLLRQRSWRPTWWQFDLKSFIHIYSFRRFLNIILRDLKRNSVWPTNFSMQQIPHLGLNLN